MEQTEIFENLKTNMPDKYEKETAGFLTYDILKASAIELEKVYAVEEAIKAKLDPSKLVGDELTRECYYRRGVARKQATSAKVVLIIMGNGTVTKGDLFSTANNIKFSSLETKTIIGTGTVIAECTTVGIVGMVGAGSITQIPITIAGITAVNNELSSYDGFEAETDESLLERYLDDIQRPATSNNIYHFEKWAREISGVGKAKVFPAWTGNNSVKVLIVDDLKLPASPALVAEVQEYIDPIDVSKWGKGYGQAAIGSYTTIASATAHLINITSEITISNNYNIETVKLAISNAITAYFQEIAFHDKINYVTYAKIAAIIISTEGVLDVENVLVNNSTDNVTLTVEEVPQLGILTIT